MHGVVLWSHKPKKAWKRVQKQGSSTQYEIINDQVSNLFTWQDQSCSPEFLDSLPVPDSHLQIYSGYGIPTIFWLKKERYSSRFFTCLFLITIKNLQILFSIPNYVWK